MYFYETGPRKTVLRPAARRRSDSLPVLKISDRQVHEPRHARVSRQLAPGLLSVLHRTPYRADISGYAWPMPHLRRD